MPIYEYQCEKCEGVFEAIQKFSDAPLTACRLCEDGTVKKLLSAPAFRLKGSGWYETDFKKDGQRNVAKADGENAAKKSGTGGEAGGAAASGGEASKSSGSGSGKSSGKSSDAA